MTQPLISVILGTYNQKTILEKVLPEYEKQTLAKTEFEIIVVDSESTDGASDWLLSYTPKFQFKALIKPNQGKAAARNRGVKEARGKWILITDADMIPHPELIQKHLDFQQSLTYPACAEGLTFNMHQLQWPTDSANLMPLIGSNPKTRTRMGWFYFLTGNLSFLKSLFESYQGFDESFQGYGWEDLELGYRLKKAGVPLYYLREAINYHYHVVPKDEEIRRNIDKGLSAKLLLAKHPELQWFLGLNPLSRFIFPKIQEGGAFYSWMQKNYRSSSPFLHRLGFWFLKEHAYLKGILRNC